VGADQVFSWVSTTAEKDERVSHGEQLVGQLLAAVRYVNLDYRRFELAESLNGPREITDEQEWQKPTWRFPGCDSVDHAVELTIGDGRRFTVTWDPPGWIEGIGLREQPAIGYAVSDTADVALWDVSDRSGWSSLVGSVLTGVEMHYHPWINPTGFWCSRVTLDLGPHRVELLLGEAHIDGQIAPSADNIVVFFDPIALPQWETTQ
jgi:hypothetical protein